jgi:hypothetical protein
MPLVVLQTHFLRHTFAKYSAFLQLSLATNMKYVVCSIGVFYGILL